MENVEKSIRHLQVTRKCLGYYKSNFRRIEDISEKKNIEREKCQVFEVMKKCINLRYSVYPQQTNEKG